MKILISIFLLFIILINPNLDNNVQNHWNVKKIEIHYVDFYTQYFTPLTPDMFIDSIPSGQDYFIKDITDHDSINEFMNQLMSIKKNQPVKFASVSLCGRTRIFFNDGHIQIIFFMYTWTSFKNGLWYKNTKIYESYLEKLLLMNQTDKVH